MNKVILMGRLTRDPEVRYTQTSNTLVASFSQQVSIIGRIQTRTWDDDQGQKHYITEVVAEEAYFAEGRRDGDSSANFDATFGAMPSANAGAGSDFEISSGDDLPF